MTEGKAGPGWGGTGQAGQKVQAGAPPLSLRRRVGQVGHDLGLVYGIEQVLGINGQGVGGREHLPLALLAQGGHGVLLGQSHLIDELRQVLVEQFLGPFDL